MKLLSKQEVLHFLHTSKLELMPRQSQVSLPILQRIHYKMNLGVDFPGIQVHENLIVNGHHRYLCAKLLDLDIEHQSWTSPPNPLLLNWKDVEISPLDFDTTENIIRFNQSDAKRCNLDVSIFNILLNSN